MQQALLVIDLQEDFFKEGRLADNRNNLVQKVNELVDYAHNKNISVIWVRQEYDADLSDAPLYNKKHNKAITICGTAGAEFLPELHRNPDDKEVIKKRYSVFFGTDLEIYLKEMNIDIVIIAGINTMTCVRTTAIDAYQRDYEVILALDAVDGYDLEQHENSLKYLQYAVAEGKHNSDILK